MMSGYHVVVLYALIQWQIDFWRHTGIRECALFSQISAPGCGQVRLRVIDNQHPIA